MGNLLLSLALLGSSRHSVVITFRGRKGILIARHGELVTRKSERSVMPLLVAVI